MSYDPTGDGDWYGERADTAIDVHFFHHPAKGWWQRLLLWLALRVAHHVIPRRDGSGPYMLRAVLVPREWRWRGRLLRRGRPYYLHYFFCSDDEIELHSHPFDAWAVILSRGYIEERWNERTQARTARVRRPGGVVRLLADTFHRVLLYRGGSWSLFSPGERVAAPREWSWFFWNPERGLLWNQAEYKRRKRAGP